MAIIGSIIKSAIDIRSRLPARRNVYNQQLRQLKKLLRKAQFTDFGRQYQFTRLLMQEELIAEFQQSVPVFDYPSLFDTWWHRILKGERDVCWPGRIRYFAL